MAAAEIGSFPPGVKRFFLLGAPIIALIIYWILPNTYTDIHNQVLPLSLFGRRGLDGPLVAF